MKETLEDKKMEEELVERVVRLPQEAWDAIEKDAALHGRAFDAEVRWLLTADSISAEKVRASGRIWNGERFIPL
jgi:plasmid stability protein